MSRLIAAMVAAISLTVAACGSDGSSTTEVTVRPSDEFGLDAVTDRLDEISAAVAAWSAAPDVGAAHRAAEEARNLIVGEAGPYFGDANGDGVVSGGNRHGLLPGLDGTDGVASPSFACLERDVLGGAWTDPARRWQILDEAITAWDRANNTFPSLPSHPMRIIGWATLTLASNDLGTAHEFAGHARLHVDISVRSVNGCS